MRYLYSILLGLCSLHSHVPHVSFIFMFSNISFVLRNFFWGGHLSLKLSFFLADTVVACILDNFEILKLRILKKHILRNQILNIREICGRQPLKNLKICLSRPYHSNFFKGCVLQISFGSFLNTLSPILHSNRNYIIYPKIS